MKPQISLVVALLLGMFVSGCGAGVLTPQGPIASNNREILFDSLAIMLAIVIPTMVATATFAWWFRASNNRARHLPDFAYSGRIELVVWSIPILVTVFLGSVIWIGAHELDPAKPLPSRTKALEVQVVSLDWKWLFIYPDQGIAAVNELVIPAGVPVHFSLTSASVMNSFFVPQLGSMIYTMNGMADQLNLQADHPGNYYGMSSHYSGDGFSDMHFRVTALPAPSFASWAQNAHGSGPTLDDTGYQALARQSTDVRPFTFRAASPNLFQDIVSQKLAPGPGPQAETGSPRQDVHPKAVH